MSSPSASSPGAAIAKSASQDAATPAGVTESLSAIAGGSGQGGAGPKVEVEAGANNPGGARPKVKVKVPAAWGAPVKTSFYSSLGTQAPDPESLTIFAGGGRKGGRRSGDGNKTKGNDGK